MCTINWPIAYGFANTLYFIYGLIIFSVGLNVISYTTIKVYDHKENESHDTLAFGAFYPGLVAIFVALYGYYVLWNRQDFIRDETKRSQTIRNFICLHILTGILSIIGIIIDGVVGYGQEDLGYFESCGNGNGRLWQDSIFGNTDDWVFGVDDTEIYIDCLLPRNTSDDCYCNRGGRCYEFKTTSSKSFSSSDCSVFLHEHEYPDRIATTFSFCVLLVPLILVLIPSSWLALKPEDQAEAFVATNALPQTNTNVAQESTKPSDTK